LVGLYRPEEGKIFYNNIDGKNIDFDTLRTQIGFVTQDTQLFAGTIKENLLFVNPAATDEEVLDVLNKASCTSLLARADNGIDTLIGEGGVKVSGGEKQRLSIARALIKDPNLIIFDDCLSAVDAKTEKKIIGTLSDYLQNKTAIIITHRIFSLFNFDKIVVLDQGKIIEQGTHYQLMAQNSYYAGLYARQQEEERSGRES